MHREQHCKRYCWYVVYRTSLLRFNTLNFTLLCGPFLLVHLSHVTVQSVYVRVQCVSLQFLDWCLCSRVLSNRLYNAATPDSMVLNYSKIVWSFFLLIVCEKWNYIVIEERTCVIRFLTCYGGGRKFHAKCLYTVPTCPVCYFFLLLFCHSCEFTISFLFSVSKHVSLFSGQRDW